ncbi:tetratricopeptide repeat protein [Methanocalculus taiwanensis]|nr:tetratricopeptide repeat protein [Methanocalculus taiwanensis]
MRFFKGSDNYSTGYQWSQLADPPVWVMEAAKRWYHHQNVPSYDGVRHFVGKKYLYLGFFEREGQGNVQWYFYRILKGRHPDMLLEKLKGAVSRYEEAITCQNAMLAKNPDDPIALQTKAIALKKLERYQEAFGCYERMLKNNPNNPNSWNNKGFVLLKLGKYEDSLQSFNRALELDPMNSWVWNNKGTAVHKLGRPEEAIDFFERALRIEPKYPDACNNMGVAIKDLGRYPEAISWFDRTLTINPYYAWAWFNKGLSFSELGNDVEAMACLNKAVELFPHPSIIELQKVLKEQLKKPIHDYSEIPRLLGLMQSEIPQDRVNASYQLDLKAKEGSAGDIIREKPFDTFFSTIKDTAPETRRNTLWILGNLGYHGYSYEVAQSGIIPEVVAQLSDSEEMVRAAAAWSLAMLAEAGQGIAVADSGAILPCIHILNDKETVVQECAALALDKIAFFGSPEPVVQHGGVSPLVKLLEKPHDEIRCRALWALWSIAIRGYSDEICQVENSITALKLSARDSNLEIRKAAVSIIGLLSKTRDKAFLEKKDLEKILLICVNSRSNRVRGAAIWAAGIWADEGLGQLLIQAGVKDAIQSLLNDRSRVHVFYDNEHRWKERSIGCISKDVIEKLTQKPQANVIDPCKPDYRTAYFISQNLLQALEKNNLIKAQAFIIHLEDVVCEEILKEVGQKRDLLLLCIDEGINSVGDEFINEVNLLKEKIHRKAMRKS